jgi:hypothetical protein
MSARLSIKIYEHRRCGPRASFHPTCSIYLITADLRICANCFNGMPLHNFEYANQACGSPHASLWRRSSTPIVFNRGLVETAIGGNLGGLLISVLNLEPRSKSPQKQSLEQPVSWGFTKWKIICCRCVTERRVSRPRSCMDVLIKLRGLSAVARDWLPCGVHMRHMITSEGSSLVVPLNIRWWYKDLTKEDCVCGW